jgi:Cytochrome P460
VLAGSAATMAPGLSGEEGSPILGGEIPPEYRDWRLISVAHEEGSLNDIRAILGNDGAV